MLQRKWTQDYSARHYAREVADRLSRLILGNQAPFQKCWDQPTGADLPPFNPATGKQYQGINAIQLRCAAVEKGFNDPRWMNYRDLMDMGAQLRVGEQGKGTRIELLLPENSSDPTHSTIHVYNAEQIDGLPALEKHMPRQPDEIETCERASRMIANTGVNIETHEHDYSLYEEKQDTIKMPAVDRFRNPRDYYSHTVVELSSWTGNKSRVDRICHHDRLIDDDEHARERMRVHIAAMNVSAELRLPYNAMAVQHHQRWSQAITHNPDELRMAASDADRISKYILDHDRQPEHPRPSDVSPSAATRVDGLPDRQNSFDPTPAVSPVNPAYTKPDRIPANVDLSR